MGAGTAKMSDAHRKLGGTLGQPVVGLVTGTSHRIGQGFWYRVESMSTHIEHIPHAPQIVVLRQNYPNPSGPGALAASASTRIDIVLPSAGHATLTLFDAMGRLRTVLINDRLQAGVHSVHIDVRVLPTGVFLYRLETKGAVLTKKMMVIR